MKHFISSLEAKNIVSVVTITLNDIPRALSSQEVYGLEMWTVKSDCLDFNPGSETC